MKMLKVHKSISKTELKEATAKAVFALAGTFAVISVFAIIIFLCLESSTAFKEIGIFNFLFGTTWSPTFEGAPASEKFGILPMIVGTTAATVGALAIGGSLGVLIAIFTVYFCPRKLKKIIRQIISLIAGIPSIIFGYFGAQQIVPLLAKISPNQNGNGLLAVSIILSIMILPTVASIAMDSLSAVPDHYYEGAVALGMTKPQAVFKILVPSASSGIFTALGLGIGRAVGETMAVIMVAGNTAQFPNGLFTSFKTLTTNIVMDLSYASGLHRDALIATGVVLLVFILILNLVLFYLKRDKTKEKKHRILNKLNIHRDSSPRHINKEGTVVKKATFSSHRMLTDSLKWLTVVATLILIAAVAYVLGFVFYMGIKAFTEMDVLAFLFGPSGNGKISLAPAFISTGALIGISLLIALPIGICAAIFLVEYSRTGSRLVNIIRLFTDTLSGIPSIIFGLFGVIVFNDALGLNYSLLSGGLTLSIMILPTIIRSVEESLLSVPMSYREASYALGAGKLHTIMRVILPCAIRGILTAIILSIGRIVSESAALLLTSGSTMSIPKNILSSGPSFAVMMYMFASEGLYMNEAYATAVVLIIMVFIINMLVLLVGGKEKKKA